MQDNEGAERVAASAPGWDTSSHEDFFKYYEQQSLSAKTMERFSSTCQTLLRVRARRGSDRDLDVLDIGCGAGAQSTLWTDLGHRYRGVDINQPLIELARKRAQQQRSSAHFEVGSATALPFADGTMDVCLLPELLEHVADWQSCVDEAVRILRPGGLLYISTTSRLCPIQEEFNLPLYSWYPAPLKRHFERRAITDWPAVANFAKYPAVNWFSFYSLRDHLAPHAESCMDRFDLMETSSKGTLARMVVGALRAVPPLRWLGHVATSYTVIVCTKR